MDTIARRGHLLGRSSPLLAALAVACLMGEGEAPAGEEGRPTGPLVRHTSDGLDKQRPAWSPDGRQLAFARHEAGGSHIRQYVMGADPSSAPRRVTKRDEPEYNAVFSPDGKTLLMVLISLSGTQGNLDIAALHADGTGQRIVARDSGKLSHQDWPAWSPDGSRFAFSSTHEGNQEIYTAAADGSQVTRVTQSLGIDAHPCWTPDGKRLLFATDRWGGLEIAGVLADGTGLTRLTRSPGLDDYPACFARRFSDRLRLEPGRPVRGLRLLGRRVGPLEPLAPPAARHLSDLASRRERGHLRLEPRRGFRDLHAVPRPREPVSGPPIRG